jgi:hypothetical protein
LYFSGEKFLDFFGHLDWIGTMVPITNNFSIFVDQEFCKVPNEIPSTALTFQIGINWVFRGSITVNFVKEREVNIVLAYKFFDFLIRTRLLGAKLVAWESKNLELIILLMQLN